MNEVDYLQQHRAERLPLGDKLQRRRLHQPQNVVLNQTTVLPADVQQLIVIKEEVSWSPSLDQQDPESLHIKEEEEEEEEEEELWTHQEGELLNGLDEADINRFSFTAVTVKSEDEDDDEDDRDAEPTTSSSAVHIKTECDGEDCGGAERDRNPDPNNNLQPDRKDSASSETEVSDGDWQEPLTDSGPESEDSDDGLTDSRTPGVNNNVGCAKKSFSCSECGKHFLHRQSLQRHMRRNSEKTSSSRCLINAKCFRLKQSSQTGPDLGEKAFCCEVCGKRHKHQHNLKTHMRVHTGERSFSCDVCGKKFKHQQNLKTHLRIHTGEKPFVCDICGKRSRHQNNLKTHMMVHTGEKPFSCDDCGKRFKRKTHLTTHMTVHKEEKPFGCDVCGKRFNRKTYLRTHMTVHTGEKPYGCDICGKRFTRKTHLEMHVTVHTGEKPFCCGVCGQGFTQQGSLNRHMRFHTA